MRYVIEFLVPAMVIIVVALVLFRNRPNGAQPVATSQPKDDGATISTGTVILVIVIGAALSVALVWALHGNAS